MNFERVEIPFGDQNLIIESGKFANQANGAVTVTCGGTIVLVTACMAKERREGVDFFPLMVEYQEKTYAAGRIPGGFFKREGRPSESEILAARVIDRPIRSLFPKGFYNAVQIVALVLSSDGEHDPDVLALVGASAALMISDIPFDGPIGTVRVGMIDDKFILNPTYAQRAQSSLDLIVAGWHDQVIMIEGEAKEVEEEKVLKALEFGLEKLKPVAEIQKELVKSIGKKKTEVKLCQLPPEFVEKVKKLSFSKILEIYKMGKKDQREEAVSLLLKDLTVDLSVFSEFKIEGRDIEASDIKIALHEVEAQEVRRIILEEKRRVDGRAFNELRPIGCEVGILPRTHGSGLFTRGQTQSLAITTLGTSNDEQMVEALEGKSEKTFMLHYNFPSFSVGETGPMRGPGRREIGHGALAEKAIRSVMPKAEEFPYTVRVVSEILESNGSSSMASVCAGTLSLMDAGVPIKDAVAGISIGLITGNGKAVLLTDIMGLEDHFGDMDFKVAGTRKGVTAIQLDLKIKGISIDLLSQATQQAKETRLVILDKMHAVLAGPREQLSTYAPRITTLHINPERIGELIGPGGKNIKKIIDATGVSIDIEDDGTVLVASTDEAMSSKAISIIRGMTEDPEVGRIYDATVKRIMNFGAFCEFLPGKEGLVHVSELSNTFVKDINKVVKVGDQFKVKVIEVDELNRVNLSKKQAE
ncbi:MAG TPA: polyribonucleotide nucleotidyltransferase [Candidatus Omnitrophota bacterium]|nr:polyribonucleotide nucleotidyltransferase [Candidatus Omnitrophota bacterium]HPD85067.1 polyribonucleotide nucleotidyltransferase [Candidatus Omnitrophota bacterium]HRZ03925.1 polyribonucleotide nucleotidyltransferase [Candidatus Omnitrophota bacterium]